MLIITKVLPVAIIQKAGGDTSCFPVIRVREEKTLLHLQVCICFSDRTDLSF